MLKPKAHLQGYPHVLHRAGSGAREELETHKDVIDQGRRPADGEKNHNSHQHLDNLSIRYRQMKWDIYP